MKKSDLLIDILYRPERRGGVILWGKWTCAACTALFIHNGPENCACLTPGCACNEYRRR